MKNEFKKYIDIEPSDRENVICIEVGYSLGGHNWYNGQEERRGYYLYCTPCGISTHKLNDGREYNTITNTLGKGLKLLLKQVSRQSVKAELEAIELAKENEEMLLNRVLSKYGLKLKEGTV